MRRPVVDGKSGFVRARSAWRGGIIDRLKVPLCARCSLHSLTDYSTYKCARAFCISPIFAKAQALPGRSSVQHKVRAPIFHPDMLPPALPSLCALYAIPTHACTSYALAVINGSRLSQQRQRRCALDLGPARRSRYRWHTTCKLKPVGLQLCVQRTLARDTPVQCKMELVVSMTRVSQHR